MSVSMTLPQYRRCECLVDGELTRLPRLQAELLALLLVSGPDRYVERETVILGLWTGPEAEPDFAIKCLGVYIFALRRLGIRIEARFGPGREHGRYNGWRIPTEGRADSVPARLAA